MTNLRLGLASAVLYAYTFVCLPALAQTASAGVRDLAFAAMGATLLARNRTAVQRAGPRR